MSNNHTPEAELTEAYIAERIEMARLYAIDDSVDMTASYERTIRELLASQTATAVREAVNKDRRRAYNKIMLKTDRKFPAPHPQSPMEFSRDAEIFNQVTAKWEKVVSAALDNTAEGEGK